MLGQIARIENMGNRDICKKSMYKELFAKLRQENGTLQSLQSIEERLRYIAGFVDYNIVPDSTDMCMIRNELIRSADLGIWAHSCDHTLNKVILDRIYDIVARE